MANANTRFLMGRIEKELRRLNGRNNEVVVTAPDSYPDGWLKIADEGGTIHGLASELLAMLEEANGGDPTDSCGTMAEPGAEVWRDFHEFVQGIRIGSMGLLVIRTNAGLRWGFAPVDAEYMAFNSTHDYSPWYHSAEVAMDAAAEFDAEAMADARTATLPWT